MRPPEQPEVERSISSNSADSCIDSTALQVPSDSSSRTTTCPDLVSLQRLQLCLPSSHSHPMDPTTCFRSTKCVTVRPTTFGFPSKTWTGKLTREGVHSPSANVQPDPSVLFLSSGDALVGVWLRRREQRVPPHYSSSPTSKPRHVPALLEPRACPLALRQPELLDLILEHVERPATLAQLRLVNRHFHQHASRRLFQRYSVHNRTRLDRLRHSLATIHQPTPTPSSSWLGFVQRLECSGLAGRSQLISDALLASIAVHPQLARSLRSVDLRGCSAVTNRGLSRLLDACRYLHTLQVDGCEQITNLAFTSLYDGASASTTGTTTPATGASHESPTGPPPPLFSLQHLHALECRHLTCATVQFLALHCRSLRTLRVSFAKQLRGTSITALLQRQPHFRHLHLTSCGKITDADLDRWAQFGYHLRTLVLECNYGQVTGEGVRRLVERLAWHRLEQLRVVLPLTLSGSSRGSAGNRPQLWTRAQIEAIQLEFPRVQIHQHPVDSDDDGVE